MSFQDTVPIDPESVGRALDERLAVDDDRPLPYFTGGQWVLLAPEKHIPSRSKLAYAVLRMYINGRREDEDVWPTLDTIAELLGLTGKKRAEAARKHIQPLIDQGAVKVRSERYGPNRMYRRNVYTAREQAPASCPWPTTLGEWHRERQANKTGRPVDNSTELDTTNHTDPVDNSGTPGHSGAPLMGGAPGGATGDESEFSQVTPVPPSQGGHRRYPPHRGGSGTPLTGGDELPVLGTTTPPSSTEVTSAARVDGSGNEGGKEDPHEEQPHTAPVELAKALLTRIRERELPERYRFTAKAKDADLVDLVCQVWAVGHDSETIQAQLTQSLSGLQDIAAAWRFRLGKLIDNPPSGPLSAPQSDDHLPEAPERPCGQCDARYPLSGSLRDPVNVRRVPDPSKPASRGVPCPRCHPEGIAAARAAGENTHDLRGAAS